MKIVCVLGNILPEEGSSAIAGRFVETAKSLGAEGRTFALSELKYSGCRGRMTCETLDKCMVEDDLTEILDAIRDADILVAASPVRHGEVTRLLRTFIERTLCFIKPDFFTNPNPSRLMAGKRMVFILTQRELDEGLFADLYPKYDYFFRWCGFHDNYLIRACGVSEASDLEAREDIMKLTEETARRVMNGAGSVDSS